MGAVIGVWGFLVIVAMFFGISRLSEIIDEKRERHAKRRRSRRR